jgi:hypothetical protein
MKMPDGYMTSRLGPVAWPGMSFTDATSNEALTFDAVEASSGICASAVLNTNADVAIAAIR